MRRVELEELVLHALVVVGERLERRRRLHLHVDVAALDQVHQRPASARTEDSMTSNCVIVQIFSWNN